MNRDPEIYRVTIRAPLKKDADLVWDWRKQEELNLHQPLAELTFPQLRDDLVRFAYRFSDRFTSDRFHWIIEKTVDQLPIGWITLSVRNRIHGIGEIGYSISAEYHHQGYGTEAIRIFLKIAFFEVGLYRIEAKCSVHNPASYRLLEKTGFQREGVLRHYLTIQGQRTDHYLYSILRT